jgi:hypothetical protein
MGGKLNEADFKRAEFVARMKIDFMTKNRLREDETVRDVVKQLVLELVERGYCGPLDGMEVRSESAGGMSSTYESKQGKAEELILMFLASEDDIPLASTDGIQFAKVDRV